MKCSFCGEKVNKGEGILFVRRDGSFLYFCKAKCRINFNMGRKSTKLKWTLRKEEGREAKASKESKKEEKKK
jgi:large subunit ribosomal protein L24e